MPNPDGSPVLLVEKRPHSLWLTLNRPHKLNALSHELVEALDAALRTAADDDEVRVVVLRGAGRAFSAGYDLAEEGSGAADDEASMKASPWRWRQELARDIDVTMRLFHLPRPTIAMVHGWALAGACELVMACDLAIASEDAKLGEPEIRYGSGPVTFLMPFVLGMRKTKELLFTGDHLDARSAEAFGLVTRVVPADELEATVERYVRTMAQVAPAVMQLTKRAVNRAYEFAGLLHAVHYNLENSTILNAAGTPEQQEWDRIVKERGLKAALAWRDDRFGTP